MVNFGYGCICARGDNGAGFDGGLFHVPVLPDGRESKRCTVTARDVPRVAPTILGFGPLIKSGRNHDATTFTTSGSKRWFFRNRFSAGVDQEGAIIWLFVPTGNKAPAHGLQSSSATIRHNRMDSICGADVVIWDNRQIIIRLGRKQLRHRILWHGVGDTAAHLVPTPP